MKKFEPRANMLVLLVAFVVVGVTTGDSRVSGGSTHFGGDAGRFGGVPIINEKGEYF